MSILEVATTAIDVLLVEDNPEDAMLMRTLLKDAKNYHFNITESGSLRKANEFLFEKQFDVILLDLSLPDANGNQVISEIYKKAPDVPIIVLTGLKDESLAWQAINEGVQDYLEKGTINTHRIQRVIRHAMERKHSEDVIKAALKEKKILLKEVHHRVKNNLQMILSILSLQEDSANNSEVREVLKETQNRFRSIALVHDLLFHSEDLTKVNIFEYIQTLSENLFQSFGVNRKETRLEIDVEPLKLEVGKVITCGLIVNELVSNSIKHNFLGGKAGTISVRVKKNIGNRINLEVHDDGTGVPESINVQEAETLGLQLVRDLVVGELKGSLEYIHDLGSTFKIAFDVEGLKNGRIKKNINR